LANPGGQRRIAQDANSRNIGRKFLDQFEPFSAEAVFERAESGGVATRPRKARDESGTHRIDDIRKHDRHAVGHPLHRRQIHAASSKNDVDVIDAFLKQYKNRPRTVQLTASYLRKTAAPLHSKPVDAITQADVAKLLRDVEASSGAVTTNRLRSTLSQVFTWGLGEALCAYNPVAHTNRRQEKPRERVLSVSELRAIWRATGSSAFGVIVRLLILTAQRRGEVAGMSPLGVEDGVWTIPSARAKNGKAHCVPLAKTAAALVASAPFPAQNWSACKYALDARSGVKDWTLHDLRRTAATMMAQDLKVTPHIVEAILNHSPGKLQATYNRADYREEKHAALTAWDQQIQKIVC
jgi:integrase